MLAKIYPGILEVIEDGMSPITTQWERELLKEIRIANKHREINLDKHDNRQIIPGMVKRFK